MIFGIGTDIVNVSRVEESISRYDQKFAEKILAASELKRYKTNASPAHFLAKRFAAKEAAAKALGTGFRNGLYLKHIVVVSDEYGKPTLKFNDYAETLCNKLGVGESFISLSDEKDYAIAYVILMKK